MNQQKQIRLKVLREKQENFLNYSCSQMAMFKDMADELELDMNEPKISEMSDEDFINKFNVNEFLTTGE